MWKNWGGWQWLWCHSGKTSTRKLQDYPNRRGGMYTLENLPTAVLSWCYSDNNIDVNLNRQIYNLIDTFFPFCDISNGVFFSQGIKLQRFFNKFNIHGLLILRHLCFSLISWLCVEHYHRQVTGCGHWVSDRQRRHLLHVSVWPK